jgi:hypothetical protein
MDVVPGEALGPVRLGASEGDLVDALGDPSLRRSGDHGRTVSLFWDRPALRVDLDDPGDVVFCEVTYGDGGPQVMLEGTDIFGRPATEVAQILTAVHQGYFGDNGYSFTCPSGLALWRPVLPDDGEDYDTDDRRGDYWRTAAVAAPGYW